MIHFQKTHWILTKRAFLKGMLKSLSSVVGNTNCKKRGSNSKRYFLVHKINSEKTFQDLHLRIKQVKDSLYNDRLDSLFNNIVIGQEVHSKKLTILLKFLTLNHEIVDNSVKRASFVAKSICASSQLQKVFHCFGSSISKQTNFYIANVFFPNADTNGNYLGDSSICCLKTKEYIDSFFYT